ncbi:MAG TPA: N-acetylmuramoyl-L-alanine amidase [Thermomicrobiales bacterium]|nr:N-acetylmuramoyl-L-alanine amidase [Thermomicrobiales bacterium]
MTPRRLPTWFGPAMVACLAVAFAALGALASLLPSDAPRCPGGAAWVVLDPGHGGADSGATNEAAGLVERDLALDIANRAAALLRRDGYGVALTRADDVTGMANTPRGRIANACRALAYVSVHLNSFGQPDPNYARTLWGVAAKDGAFAETMQAALVSELAPGTDLGDGGLDELENGGLLTARMPAVMVEPVFLSNPAEARRLRDASGARRQAIAQAIADGVDGWLRGQGIVRGAPTGLTAPVVTAADRLVGPARGSASRALAAALAAGAQRPDDVRAYLDEVYRLAPAVGLDPALVVAQSALETGWWRSPAWTEHLNPAGIGVTGPDAPSPTWTSGADAARAQIVHLYLYAVGAVPANGPLAAFVKLDPRYDVALDAGRAGSAPTLAELAGRWAADPAYGDSIARVARELFGDG